MRVISSRLQCANAGWKNLAKSRDQRAQSREWFANLLWVAFPAHSEAELCKKASAALGASSRQARNWLRCENDAPVSVVTKVLMVAGAEVVFKKIEGGE
jgi:hypothetical protein